MAKAPPVPIVKFVDGLRAKLAGMHQRMVPAQIAALDFVGGMWNFQIVYALCELGIPDRLTNDPRSAEDIATEVGAVPDRVYRLLRAASTIGVARECPKRAFVSTPVGNSLRSDALGSVRDFILFQGRLGWQNWGGLTDCIRNGNTAIENIHGKKPFDFFTSEAVAPSFNSAMTGVSAMTADAVLAAYSFARFKKVADIGGGHGRLLGTVLRDYPDLRGVLFDLPSVVKGAPEVLREMGVAERCEVVGGDFFEAIAVSDADLYLLKSIIHDWADEDAVKILRRLSAAMKPDARIGLVEVVIPGPNEPSFGKHLDIEMIVHAGGKERTETEYATLFETAGLRLAKIIPTAGPMSVVEAARP